MLGAILVAIAIIFVIPASFMMGGLVIASVLGGTLKADAEARHEGSELIELHK